MLVKIQENMFKVEKLTRALQNMFKYLGCLKLAEIPTNDAY
jgi:hypothetical protein